jgi:hypothetical protein
MKLHRILLLILGVFLGCDDEPENLPEPQPITVFSLTVEPGYSFKADNWVMVHDKNGVLLDAEQITTAGTVKFETDESVLDGKVGITIFRHDIAGTIDSYSFTSYLSVPIGQEWIWRKYIIPPEENQGTSVGTFSATYTLPEPLRMDLFGNSTTLGSFSQTGNIKSYQATIYEKNKNFLLTVAGDGKPRYKLFENVKNGDYFQITFEDMEEYDQVLDISFPSASNPYVTVSALDGDGKSLYWTYYNAFNLPPFGPSVSLTNLKIGYLERFEKYHTNIQIVTPSFGFGFEKVGPAPSAISLPDHSPFQLINKTLTNFSYSNEIPFSIRSSNFKDDSLTDKNIWWVCYAPQGDDKVSELPGVFVETYPFIKLQNFKHLNTSFQSSTKSYMNFIDAAGSGILFKGELETTTIRVQ